MEKKELIQLLQGEWYSSDFKYNFEIKGENIYSLNKYPMPLLELVFEPKINKWYFNTPGQEDRIHGFIEKETTPSRLVIKDYTRTDFENILSVYYSIELFKRI